MNKKENWGEKILKQKIEFLKKELERYKKVLIKYAFTETCTASIYFKDLFLKLMKTGADVIRDSKKPEKQKNKLIGELWGFGHSDKTLLEFEHDFYERLVWWAKHNLESLDYKIKEKIIDDSLTMQDAWSEQFNRNSKIFKKLEKKKK